MLSANMRLGGGRVNSEQYTPTLFLGPKMFLDLLEYSLEYHIHLLHTWACV